MTFKLYGTAYKVVRRDDKPALDCNGTHVIAVEAGTGTPSRNWVYLNINELPF